MSSESTLNQKRNELLKLLYDVLGDILTSSGSIVTALSDVSTETTLSSVDTSLLEALGGAGTEFRPTGAHTGDTFKYIVVNEDAVFSVITGDGATNLLTQFGLTASDTVTKGMILRPAAGELIEDITIDSGSIIGVN